MSEYKIEPVHEQEADTRQLCEIRIDCLVVMHKPGFKKLSEGEMLSAEKWSKTPQWFKSKMALTLEQIKCGDPYDIGMQIKNMYIQLEKTIDQYEQIR